MFWVKRTFFFSPGVRRRRRILAPPPQPPATTTTTPTGSEGSRTSGRRWTNFTVRLEVIRHPLSSNKTV